MEENYGAFVSEYTQDQIDWMYQNGVAEAIAYKQDMELLEEKVSAYRESDAALNDVYQNITAYEAAATASLNGDVNEVVEILGKQNDGFKTAASVAGESTEEQKRILEEQYENALLTLERYEQKYNEGMEGYNEDTLNTLRKTAENAKIEAEKLALI